MPRVRSEECLVRLITGLQAPLVLINPINEAWQLTFINLRNLLVRIPLLYNTRLSSTLIQDIYHTLKTKFDGLVFAPEIYINC
jgi:hypothetical protein